MELRIALSNGFNYDLWANRQWLASLGGFDGQMLKAQGILEHILGAQRIWLGRCGMTVFTEEVNVRLDDLFQIATRAWQSLLEGSTGYELITYQNSLGEEYTNTLSQIGYHVLNHGTYHRGQLRGLAESVGFLDFPETDLILYLRELNVRW